MAQSGQLRGKVSENQLIELLDQVRIVFHGSISFCLFYQAKMEDVQGKSSSKKSTIVVRHIYRLFLSSNFLIIHLSYSIRDEKTLMTTTLIFEGTVCSYT